MLSVKDEEKKKLVEIVEEIVQKRDWGIDGGHGYRGQKRKFALSTAEISLSSGLNKTHYFWPKI